MDAEELDGQVHSLVLAGVLRGGCAPRRSAIAAATGVDEVAVGHSLLRLAAGHGLVLHPHRLDPWVVHPFSLVPTAFWVAGETRGWWAPCIWCALGVAALVGGSVTIHTRSGGEAEPLAISVRGDALSPTGLVAHFPVPIVRAWDNVHEFCGCTLVFRAPGDVDGWCARHGRTKGDVQPLERVLALARAWYAGHASPRWRKWTSAEARAHFAKAGLHGPTWELPATDERF